MPRMGRVVVPQYPHHIVQRGHDRNVVFASESDFRYYLDTLTEFKELCGVHEIEKRRIYLFGLAIETRLFSSTVRYRIVPTSSRHGFGISHPL